MPQSTLAQLGLPLTQISKHLPFSLIQCPLCHGTTFESLEGASVWCRACNARFQVGYTSGDPGFSVDCTWEFYSRRDARYLLPDCPEARLTFTLKDSADLLDLEPCAACGPDRTALTDGTNGLRAGLHACAVGTLYDWRLVGQAPEGWPPAEASWKVGPDHWPRTASLRVSRLQPHEVAALSQAADRLDGGDDDLAAALRAIGMLRAEPAAIWSAPLPPFAALADRQSYLLHHWLSQRAWHPHGTPRDCSDFVLPVWFTVTPGPEKPDAPLAWQVVHRDLCPACGRRVSPEQFLAPHPGPHAGCARTWQNYGWRPVWDQGPAAPDCAGQTV